MDSRVASGADRSLFARVVIITAFFCALFGIACGPDSTVRPAPTPPSEAPPQPRATTCRAPAAAPAFRLVDFFPGLERFDRPVEVKRLGESYFVAGQGGVVRRVTRQGTTDELILTITERLIPPPIGEGGLIGFAPSPDFETTREVFVVYTAPSPTAELQTVISRFTLPTPTDSSSPPTEEVLISFDRDHNGHHGGRLVFGPDRYLYIGVGDGSWGDPLNRAQNPNELFGKILRIDVLDRRAAAEAGLPYAIPHDNPFVAGGGRPEVYALGFRNPWAFSFDARGRLWLGDVGHVRWEEVNIVTKGGNYGWPLREGRHCFEFSPSPSECGNSSLIDPIFEYAHVDGFSVTGGFVYSGKSSMLAGSYVFGDFMTGRIWAIDASGGQGNADPPLAPRLILDSAVNIVTFAEDENGEILVVDFGGHVSRLEVVDPDAQQIEQADQPVATTTSLRELGCLNQPGFTPYEVNAQLWSDGLDKRRWLFIPPDARMQRVERAGNPNVLELPKGSIVLKEFSDSSGRRIETRMLVRDPTYDTWLGYTFEWNESQTDATLLPDEAKTVDIDGSPWTLPSRAQCFTCHRKAVGGLLGFELAQLNRTTINAEGVVVNQLDDFVQNELLDPKALQVESEEAGLPDPFPDPYNEALPIEPRARAYLHANCSFCHGADASPQGLLDFRSFVPSANMHVSCRTIAFEDAAGATSTTSAGDGILLRMQGQPRRMPPLGTSRIDTAAIKVVSSWIGSMGSNCP